MKNKGQIFFLFREPGHQTIAVNVRLFNLFLCQPLYFQPNPGVARGNYEVGGGARLKFPGTQTNTTSFSFCLSYTIGILTLTEFLICSFSSLTRLQGRIYLCVPFYTNQSI